MIDLDAYFERIGYRGAPTPTLATLRALQLAHVSAIPFENLSVWRGQPVSVELPAIGAKLIHARRGGYCYEHNTLFAAVLQALGFEVMPRLARVRWQVPAEVITGRSHLCLNVAIDGRTWLVDAGFGGIGPTAPLDLAQPGTQSTPHEPRRMQADPDGSVRHHVDLGGETWAEVYRMEPSPVFPVDVAMANWFTSTHPQSLFRRSLIVTRVQPDHRRMLRDREYSRRYLDGRLERRTVESVDDLRGVLIHEFGLPAADPILADLELPSVTAT